MANTKNYFQPHSLDKASLASKGPDPKPHAPTLESMETRPFDQDDDATRELDEMLYARHAEIQNLEDLTSQRGTNVPALFNQVYKFIQNPSTVSVETFKRMVDTDDTIGSGVDFLTTCLAARIGQYQHESEEISEWVNKRLEEIQGGWVNSMKELLSASWAGFAVAEKVWANTENGFVPQKLVHLPPSTLLFEVERTGEMTQDGILQFQRNYNPALYGGGASNFFGYGGLTFGTGPLGWRPDAYAKFGDMPYPVRTPSLFNYLSIRIPKAKCIHYSFDAQGKFGNHYGRSLLRRVYKHWVVKDEVLKMLATALDRKGTPLTMVYVDPNNTFIDTEANANPGDLTNKQAGMRAQLAVKRAFEKIHNDSVIILPGKKGQFIEADWVNQQSNAGDFIQSLDFLNKSIMRGLLIPSLIFTNGDGTGSNALGAEHAKTFDKILDGVLSGFVRTLIDQLVSDMIKLNFPESAWKKDGFGDFGQRELTQDERQKEMDTVEKAVTMGAIDLSDLDDLNKAREIAGFKVRTEPIPQPDPLDFGDDPENDQEDGSTPKPNSSDSTDKPDGKDR